MNFDLNMFKMSFRHAASNDEKTFGYKFNLKYGVLLYLLGNNLRKN